METIPFDASTHRIVMYKGNPVALPLLTYWKLSDLKPDDTVIIQEVSESLKQYQRVKVSELSEVVK